MLLKRGSMKIALQKMIKLAPYISMKVVANSKSLVFLCESQNCIIQQNSQVST